jgi:hypothetical protein
MAFTDIHARTWPTCQAVTPALNFVGLGNLPALTIRHRVGAEKGRGATLLAGLLQLRTSWDSRSHALSGSASNTACVGCLGTTGEIVAFLAVLTGLVTLLLQSITFDIKQSLINLDATICSD